MPHKVATVVQSIVDCKALTDMKFHTYIELHICHGSETATAWTQASRCICKLMLNVTHTLMNNAPPCIPLPHPGTEAGNVDGTEKVKSALI